MSEQHFGPLAILFLVLPIQLILFLSTLKRIGTLAGLFPSGCAYRAEETEVVNSHRSEITPSGSGSETVGVALRLIRRIGKSTHEYLGIQDAINTHLSRNQSNPVELNSLKEIVETTCESIDESINLTISTPLYLGLIATMAGIVIGLFEFSSSGGDSQSEQVNHLIVSVKYAMICSAAGLFFTMMNSSFWYRKARTQLKIGLSEFYRFIQTEILPFAPGVTSSLVLLDRNLRDFNAAFAGNITSFRSELASVKETLELQRSVLKELKQIDIAQFAQRNLEVYNALKNSSRHFGKFDEYLRNIGGLLENSIKVLELAEEIKADLGKYRVGIESVAEEIRSKLDQSQKLMDFLERHFQSLDSQKQGFGDAVVTLDTALRASVSELGEFVQQSISNIRQMVVTQESKVGTLVRESESGMELVATQDKIAKLTETMDRLINTVSQIVAQPRFDVAGSQEPPALPSTSNISSQQGTSGSRRDDRQGVHSSNSNSSDVSKRGNNSRDLTLRQKIAEIIGGFFDNR